MTAAAVPIVYRSAAVGSSTEASRCATRRSTRCSARAASTAAIDFSRDTESGTIT
jgi:hypothetical protein